jgi:hypothetical protein
VNPVYRKWVNSASEEFFQVHLNLLKPSVYWAFLAPLHWEMFPLKQENKSSSAVHHTDYECKTLTE